MPACAVCAACEAAVAVDDAAAAETIIAVGAMLIVAMTIVSAGEEIVAGLLGDHVSEVCCKMCLCLCECKLGHWWHVASVALI